jgi:hypothetical protein
MADKPVEAVALTSDERLDRLELALQAGLNLDLGEFDTPGHQAQNKAAADQAAADELAAQQAAAEQAAAAPPDAPTAASGATVGTIVDYDNQTIDTLAPQIAALAQADLDTVAQYEAANQNRVGILDLTVKRQGVLDAPPA